VLRNLKQTLGRLRGLNVSDPPGAADTDALAERIERRSREQV